MLNEWLPVCCLSASRLQGGVAAAAACLLHVSWLHGGEGLQWLVWTIVAGCGYTELVGGGLVPRNMGLVLRLEVGGSLYCSSTIGTTAVQFVLLQYNLYYCSTIGTTAVQFVLLQVWLY